MGTQDEADADIREALENTTSQYGAPQNRARPLILLADDDPEIRKILRAHFETMDCDLLEGGNGAEALESIIVHQPNLVILDVMMPELNGWEVCKYVREHGESLPGVGIIMLTAIGAINNELTSPLFGADEYIDKPFDLDELDFKTRKVLSERAEH
jgi:DNA-binding response OmpR family regulator